MPSKSSKLLSATKYYQWILCFFAVTSPLSLVFNSFTRNSKSSGLLNGHVIQIVFFIYSGFILIYSLWVSYLFNVRVIDVKLFEGDSITHLLELAQTLFGTILQIFMHYPAVVQASKLEDIYDRIAALEWDIGNSVTNISSTIWPFEIDTLRRFQCRLLSVSGCVFLFIAIISLVKLTLVVKIISEYHWLFAIFIEALIRMKCFEYCVVVQVIYEIESELLNELTRLKNKIEATTKDKNYLYRSLAFYQSVQSKIWDLSDKVQKYFSLPMAILTLFNAIAAMNDINWAFLAIIYSPDRNYNKRNAVNLKILKFTIFKF